MTSFVFRETLMSHLLIWGNAYVQVIRDGNGRVLEHPGVLKDPAKIRESGHSVYGGSRNAGKVAVLEEGLKYQQIGIPPEEAQFLETRKFQIDEIARLYRIPPHMVGLDKSSFSNIE